MRRVFQNPLRRDREICEIHSETFDLHVGLREKNLLRLFLSFALRYASLPVSHPVTRLPVAGLPATLLIGLAAITLAPGCSRNAPPADGAPKSATATPTAAPADKSGTPAAKTGSPVAAAPAGDKAGQPPAAASSTPGGATASATPATGRKAGEAEKDRARQSAAEQVPVETAPVTRGPISAFLSFNSTLETEAAVDIYPQTTGQVEALLVEEGKIVKAGDPLLKIEDRELRVDLDETSANYEQLLKNFARNEELFGRNLINKQDFETQKYQVEQARLRLERAKIRLAYATVRAPFDGVISSRETQVGARVSNGTKVFSMVKLDDIMARVYVPGRYLSIVAVNQAAVVSSEFLPDRNFKGWVKRISPVIDPKSGTFKVTVGVRGDKPAELPPGLFVSVRVITDTRASALLIPKRALVYEGGERYVFCVVDGKAVKRKLVAGYEDPNQIEALSGFEVGTPIIVLGHNGLKDGASVRIVNALEPIAAPAEDGAEPKAETPKKAVATSSESTGSKT